MTNLPIGEDLWSFYKSTQTNRVSFRTMKPLSTYWMPSAVLDIEWETR